MTLDEAIADVATDRYMPGLWTGTHQRWVNAMLEVARGASGYAWGILWGSYSTNPVQTTARLRAYWQQHARLEPEEKWREVPPGYVSLECRDVLAASDSEVTIRPAKTSIRSIRITPQRQQGQRRPWLKYEERTGGPS